MLKEGTLFTRGSGEVQEEELGRVSKAFVSDS